MPELTDSRDLMSDYFEISNEISLLEAKLKIIKSAIQSVVEQTEGKKIGVEGLGTAQWIEGTTTSYSYDTKLIDFIKDQALKNGDVGTARAIIDAQKSSPRAGSLRISKAKQGKD